MLKEPDALWLYHLTLRPPSHGFASVVGNFTGTKKTQELVVATNTTLEVYRPNIHTGSLEQLACRKVLALLRRIEKIRLPGTTKDLLVVTADSGILSVLELNAETMRWVSLVQHPHSKNGLRRLTPGEYLCAEPRGRAVLLAAVERDALVYKVEYANTSGSDTDRAASDPHKLSARVSLSSPLLVTTKNTLTLYLCALDTAHENPMWAALETDYADAGKGGVKTLLLTYYELDQGLNHVVRRRSREPVPGSATVLIPMPAHVGGVLVSCGTYLIYEDGPATANRLYLPLPARRDAPVAPVVCYLLHTLKSDFFLLLHTAAGDLIKVTLSYDLEREQVRSLAATYFDTVPVCTSINVFRAGYLFANTVVGGRLMYQFELLGMENDTTVRSVRALADAASSVFSPGDLQHLALVDEGQALAPLADCILSEGEGDAPDPAQELVAVAARGLTTLKYGLAVSEVVSAPLPMAASDIYTTRMRRDASGDEYLVLTSALAQRTFVLSVGEVVEEVSDSGLDTAQHTLVVQQVGAYSLAQVHSNGVRVVKHMFDADGAVTARNTTDWFPPAGILVLHASCNNEQLVVALSNREVVYFEVDAAADQLAEYQARFESPDASVTAVAVASRLQDTLRGMFAVVAAADDTVLVLSLLPHNCLAVVSVQALSSACRSLQVLPADADTFTVHMGLDNGTYVRVAMDRVSGRLYDSRPKYLGPAPVRLASVPLLGGPPAVLAFSTRPWLSFVGCDRTPRLLPLVNTAVTCGASFVSSDLGSDSVVGVCGDVLSIFTFGIDGAGWDRGSNFVSNVVPLRYTPRKLVRASRGVCYVLEAQQNAAATFESKGELDAGQGRVWASCIQAVDHDTETVVHTYELAANLRAICMTVVAMGSAQYLVVGVSQDRARHAVHTLRIAVDHLLALVHETAFDGPVTALAAFGDRVVAGVGTHLRIYEMGKKQLLKKCSTPVEYLSRVTKIEHVNGTRFAVADAAALVSYVNYDASHNRFVPHIADTASRAVTAFASLDTRTVAAGDRFGNVFVCRVPQSVAAQMANNVLTQFQDDFLNGPGFRFARLCDFYVGDVPTAFMRGSFVVGGTNSLIYTGIQGTVGIMVPVATQHEVQFLLLLEAALRKVYERELDDDDARGTRLNLVGREQLKFRGYYNPVKNVVDGDFLETYYELDSATKIKVAGDAGRTPREIERKLYDMRNRAAF